MLFFTTCAYDAAGRQTVCTGHTVCKGRRDRMLPELSGQHVFPSSSSISPSPVLSRVSTDVWMEPFFAWIRSDTLADNCPIVTVRCLRMKAAYPYRRQLLTLRATGLYVYCFRMVYATFSNFFMTEKMKTAETRHTPTNTPHTIHRGKSPQIHAATAVK